MLCFFFVVSLCFIYAVMYAKSACTNWVSIRQSGISVIISLGQNGNTRRLVLKFMYFCPGESNNNNRVHVVAICFFFCCHVL